tara:strand:- start:179 stop:955 length:777 start_codon:yes stop_codon:yes gene_type:complete
VVLISLQPSILKADQPVMNMMPRWDGGFGWQILYETVERSKLMQGGLLIDPNKSEEIDLIHLQGVYTWDRSIRMTIKIPYVLEAVRENLDGSTERYNGLGDIKVAVPLKKYFNLDGRTGSWAIAPQAVIPTGDFDQYDFHSREWGSGVSVGYETETYDWFFASGASYWIYEKEPDHIAINLDLGVNLYDSMQILLENDYHYENDGARRLSVGPSIYFRQNLLTHWRVEFKKDYFVSAGKTQLDHVDETKISLGVGFVY